MNSVGTTRSSELRTISFEAETMTVPLETAVTRPFELTVAIAELLMV